MLYLIPALICAALGVLPLILRKRFRSALIVAAAAVPVLWLIGYLSLPAFVGPYWGGGATAWVIALWVVCGIVAYMADERAGRVATRRSMWDRDDRRDPDVAALKKAALFPALGIILVIARLAAGWSAFRAAEYAALVGPVEERVWTQDVQPKDPHHIRLVPIELAKWLADKQLGEAKGAIGSQFQIDGERMTLQMIHGELWYVAPLDFKDLGVWMSSEAAPGYVMVSGEDPLREVIVKTDRRFVFTPNAYFGKNLERHLRENGYAMNGLTDYSFEIDEDGKPWWIVTVYHPSIAWGGEKIDGIVTVDPSDGASKFYPLGSAPEWVDRVVPAEIAHDYIAWHGSLAAGWLNSWWGKHDLSEPETLTFVHGSDGRPYWVTDVTSTNASDNSLIGLMYTDARTGKSVYYRAKGGTVTKVVEAVNSKITYKKWHGASPIVYNMYGTMASIVPLLGESHVFQGVAIVNVDNLQVAIGDDLQGALREYQKLVPPGSPGVAPQVKHETRTIEGKLDRFASSAVSGYTTFWIHLEGQPYIFTGGNELCPKLPLAKPGDKVRVTFVDTGEDVMPMLSFDDLSIPLGAPR